MMSRILIFSTIFAALSFAASAQDPSPSGLFKSSVLTPVNSFTEGVEGPAVDKSGNVYAVNLARQGTIGQITPEGKTSIFIELPDGSIGNGIRFNSRGDMLIADYTNHNILRVDMRTKIISVFAHEARMNQPNDIAIDSKDRLYASDPDWKSGTGQIWRIDNDGKVTFLDSLGTTNGIDLSPDEKTLYVNASRKVWAYDLLPNGDVSNKHVLIEFSDFGMDGMRCDIKGNLYIARFGKGMIAVVSPKGEIIREVPLTGKRPTNVAFGGNDGRTMYVTLQDQGNLESFRVDVPGREWEMQKAQKFNIIIKGGHVIDPKNNIDDVMDIAVKNGRISLIAKDIDPKEGIQVVNAEGMYVTPGLIDMHVHVFQGTNPDQQYMNGPSSVVPDGFTFRTGVTTVVDAGCAGWRTFPVFKRQTIDRSQTRVLAFLNIVGEGMRGNPFEQNLKDMDPQVTARFALENNSDIVGIKLAHFEGPDWTPVDRSVEAGKLANMPVMVDFGGSDPPLSIEELFMKHLRPGDIFTHCFAQLGKGRESIVDPATGKVKPFVWEAVKRGIVFDVGYGGISFAFSQGIPAIKSGLYPQAISTDLHIGSMNGAMKDMLTTMSKFLAMGMDLQSVIKASTWIPARVIKREELGNLSPGSEADITILSIRNGRFGLFDYTGYKIETDKKFECEMTIRAGKIVYDLNGIAEPVTLYGR